MNAKYQQWLECPGMNDELLTQLKNMTDEQISDSFYRELAFGTGGLRGVLGAGTNRMNLYTVSKATRGLGKYLLETFENPSCAVSCDSRIHSTDFARLTAATLANMGIRVYIYKTLMPTPMLSYAVRHLKTSAGVMVTASHNPAKFNGYKVYGSDGCQITIEAADRIYGYICAEETLVESLPDFDTLMEKGMISWIDDETIESYYQVMDGLRIAPATERLHLVYSPLNGTGNVPVREMMKRMGNIDVEIVAEQEGHPERYIFGFEESYGYLSGTDVRDKDAVNAAVLVCEMAANYKAQGLTLLDKLELLRKEHGFFAQRLLTFEYEGESGAKTMAGIMANLRKPLSDFADEAFQTCTRIDYENDDTGLPKSDVLSFALANGCKIIVRPSGTEPKLKAYLFAKGADQAGAEAVLDTLEALMSRYCKA